MSQIHDNSIPRKRRRGRRDNETKDKQQLQLIQSNKTTNQPSTNKTPIDIVKEDKNIDKNNDKKKRKRGNAIPKKGEEGYMSPTQLRNARKRKAAKAKKAKEKEQREREEIKRERGDKFPVKSLDLSKGEGSKKR